MRKLRYEIDLTDLTQAPGLFGDHWTPEPIARIDQIRRATDWGRYKPNRPEFTKKLPKNAENICFCVTDVIAAGYTYVAGPSTCSALLTAASSQSTRAGIE